MMRSFTRLGTATFSTLMLVAAAAGTIAPAPAEAFCGFYVAGSDARLLNGATTVALMREGTRTVLSMQNAYEGPPEDFAMVVPVPIVLDRANVRTLPRAVFDRLEQLTAPRLVEYWEQDPCSEPSIGLGSLGTMGFGATRALAQGYGSGFGSLGVRVEARFEVGEYNVVILSARDSSGLDTWLRRERYRIPEGAGEVLAPYVRAGMKFFVAKVDARRVRFENGRAVLSPLRFHYDSESFALPVRLGLLNSPGAQDLIVHILSREGRFEAANRPNAFIPTNLSVNDGVRSRFAEFYAALFDRTIERTPGAVLTEYSWSAATCDPCPVAPLDANEIATLGGDVINGPSTLRPVAARPTPPIPTEETVSEGLSREIVRRVVRRNSAQVRHCYEQGLVNSPSARGVVLVEFTIGEQGAVVASRVAQSTLAIAGTEGCIAHAIRRWQFPAPEMGAPVTVRFPFVLDPSTVAFRVNGFGPNAFTLTRLHARYGREISDDLVFRSAHAVAGGREEWSGATIEEGAQLSIVNNFQARYAIRHRWEGPVRCANPQRGVWGGPPSGEHPAPTPARGLAFAARGALQLDTMISSWPTAVTDGGLDAQSPTAAADGGAAAHSSARDARPEPSRSARCSVAVGPLQYSQHGVAMLALGAALSLRRRRRSRRAT